MDERAEFYAVAWTQQSNGARFKVIWATLDEAKKHAEQLVSERLCIGTPRIARFAGEWVE